MRTELIKEMKKEIESKIGVDYEEVMYEAYPEPDEDDWMADDYEPEEVFNKDGIIAVIEYELGDIFIDGLTPEEINALKGGEI